MESDAQDLNDFTTDFPNLDEHSVLHSAFAMSRDSRVSLGAQRPAWQGRQASERERLMEDR